MRISDWSSDVCSSDLLHKVAETIGAGLIDKDLVTPAVVFGALVGAMFWNIVTWLKRIPSSSSHALVGGIVGAGVAPAGFAGIQWAGLNKTVIATFLSPLLGMLLSMLAIGRASSRASVCQYVWIWVGA